MTLGSVDNARSGEVFIDDFDRGVVTTLGAVVDTSGQYMVIKNVPRVEPPPGFEGVPVYFAMPDEDLDSKIIPSFIVRRDGITPAMSRWHLGSFDYNVPAAGAKPVEIINPRTGSLISSGFDKYERKDQAVPYDFLYTIQIRAKYRNNLKAAGLAMLKYLMRKYQPYTRVEVMDSLGDTRYYDAFTESPSAADIMPDITGRETDFNIPLRVEGEIDLNDPQIVKVLSNLPNFNFSVR